MRRETVSPMNLRRLWGGWDGGKGSAYDVAPPPRAPVTRGGRGGRGGRPRHRRRAGWPLSRGRHPAEVCAARAAAARLAPRRPPPPRSAPAAAPRQTTWISEMNDRYVTPSGYMMCIGARRGEGGGGFGGAAGGRVVPWRWWREYNGSFRRRRRPQQGRARRGRQQGAARPPTHRPSRAGWRLRARPARRRAR
jgi:hypothetical protein